MKTVAETFGLTSRDPYPAVRALQVDFDPSGFAFSDEYYDVLGLEQPRAVESEA